MQSNTLLSGRGFVGSELQVDSGNQPLMHGLLLLFCEGESLHFGPDGEQEKGNGGDHLDHESFGLVDVFETAFREVGLSCHGFQGSKMGAHLLGHGFRLLGCLAYITAESRVDQFIGMYFQRAYDHGDIVIQDCAAIAGPGSARVLPMRLIRPVLTRFTCLAAAEPVLTEPSKVSQLVRAARIDDLPLGPHGALDAPDGADLWHRYENGVKTGKPLWPWPMNDRIKALISVDVTATVMELARVPLDRRPAAQKPPPQDR